MNLLYSRNSDYFKHIERDEQAYILGFLYADGCLFTDRGRGYRIQIGLHNQDREILEKIKDYIGYEGPLLEKKPHYVRLVISDKKIFQDLLKLGLHPRKTFTINFPFNINQKLYSAFIRGYYDGDGYVTYTPANDKRRQRFNCGIVSANKGFLEAINFIGGQHINVFGKMYQHGNAYKLVYHNSKANAFLDWIYRNANIYLERKHSKYLHALTKLKKREIRWNIERIDAIKKLKKQGETHSDIAELLSPQYGFYMSSNAIARALYRYSQKYSA